jgi:hypothetical protein
MRTEITPIVGAVLGTLIAWLGTSVGFPFFNSTTAGYYIEVGEILVPDVKVGESPQIHVERTIKHDFSGEWNITLRRQIGDTFAFFCSRQGKSDYWTNSGLPARTDLDWWMGIPPSPPCETIPPGRYMVSMTWIIDLPGEGRTIVRAESNVFSVIP